MILLSRNAWETAAGVTLVATLAVGAIWWFRRKRPTEEELERARRKLLAQTGRVVDGMFLDIREMSTDDGRTLTMLEYSYRSAGVDYECSQDITTLLTVIDRAEMRAGFPLLGAIPARKPAEQHCDSRRMVRRPVQPPGLPPRQSPGQAKNGTVRGWPRLISPVAPRLAALASDTRPHLN